MRIRSISLRVLAIWWTAISWGQPKALSCATCHVKEAASQVKTPMARALLLAGDNPTLRSRPRLGYERDGFQYAVETNGNRSTYNVSKSGETVSLPIEWTFGMGAQTFVLERDGQFLESAVSYYPEIDRLDVTMGAQGLHPTTVEEALGRPLGHSDAVACFGCHTSGAVANDRLNFASLKPGVTCEHCHSGAAVHSKTMAAGLHHDLKASMPPQLGKLSAESLSNFCGQCHRSWETVVRNHWRGEINVRFQPYRLANSKCFDGRDARISCVACHNPHEDLVRDEKAYDAKCLACHAAAGSSVVAKGMSRGCAVARSNCVGCHMPKVQLPGGHETFSDHQIRVVRNGDGYPN